MDEIQSMVTQTSSSALTSVPGAFAEKAMASLMQLHNQLMDEKERRVELYRRLMEREQTVAELRMYVKLLEDKLGVPAPPPPSPVQAAPAEMKAAPPESKPRPAPSASAAPKRPVSETARAQQNWRAW